MAAFTAAAFIAEWTAAAFMAECAAFMVADSTPEGSSSEDSTAGRGDYGDYSLPSATPYWYCSDPPGYYPYLTQCDTAWQTAPGS